MLGRRSARIIAGLVGVLLIVAVGLWWTRIPTQKLIAQARAALEAGRPAEARRLALIAVGRDGSLTDAWLLAARAAQELGQLSEAVEYLRQVDTNAADGVQARVDEAGLLIRLGRLWEASEAFESATEAAPHDAGIRKRLIQLLVGIGRRRTAVPHLLQNVRSGRFADGDLRLLGDVARVVQEPEMLNEARKLAPEDPGVLLGLAEVARNDYERDEARRLYEKLLKSSPEIEEAWAGLGLLATKPNEYAAWEQRFSNQETENPDVWYLRGRAAFERGDLRGAVRCAWESARRDSEHQQAHYLAGQALVVLNEPSRAKPFVKRAELLLQLTLALSSVFENPRHPGPMRDAARLTESLRRPWEAQGWAKLILALQPDDPFALSLIGRMQPLLGDDTPQTIKGSAPAELVDLSGYPFPTVVVENSPKETSNVAAGTAGSDIRFTNDAAAVGIQFTYNNGRTLEMGIARIVETTGGGVAVLDYDRDGRPDLYFTQGGVWPAPRFPVKAAGDVSKADEDRLFRNHSGKTFADVSEPSGLGDPGFGQGATVGDFDNDGFPDLYVANLGPNRLYRNNGDGTFADVTQSAGISGDHWTTSCLVADLNGDGLPDIYDVNYCSGKLDKICGDELCSPRAFDAVIDQVWLSRGDGTFEEVTHTCGVVVPKGYGLGIVAAAFDEDRSVGLFIANDEVPNFLFANQARPGEPPRYEEQAHLHGVAVDGNGKSLASMGVAAGDADGDGRIDLFVTTFYKEPDTLFLQESPGSFVDRTRAKGLHEPTLLTLGFGTQFLDADRDGWLDLVVTNGHIDDYSHKGIPYQMPPQFFRNMGAGSFRELRATTLGEYFEHKWLGRGLARLDWNGDGLEDFTVSHIGAPAALATNRTPNVGAFLAVQLVGTQSSRDAVGSILHLTAGKRQWTAQLIAGDGYHASNERQVVFGLGDSTKIDSLEVRWPSGKEQTFGSVPLNHRIRLVEGSSVVEESAVAE